MRRKYTLITHSEAETKELGRLIGEAVPPGTFISLIGEMGAGKTHLVQGVAAGLGIDASITSPTFTLVNEYAGGRLPLVHMDLFRLVSEDDIIERGIEEYLTAEAVALVEWPEVMGSLTPGERIEIHLSRMLEEGQEDWRSIEAEVLGADNLGDNIISEKWLGEVFLQYADTGI